MRGLILIFAIIATVSTLWITLDFTQKQVFIVEEGSGLVDLYGQVPLEIGQLVPQNGFIHARDGGAVLRHASTKLVMKPNSDVQIKYIENDYLSFFSTRGTFSISPDRTIEVCTRAVCAATSEKLQVNYITPGEIVEITPGGSTSVLYNKTDLFQLEAGDFIRIDELTGETTLTSTEATE